MNAPADPPEPSGSSRSALASRHAAAVVGLCAAAFVVIKTGRDAAFFGHSGLGSFPAVLFCTQVGLAATAYVHVLALRRFGARATRVALFTLAAAAFAAFAGLVRPGGGAAPAAFFVFVPSAFAALFASAWLLAGDLLDGAPAADRGRAYARIGAAGLLGGVVGGVFARAVAGVATPTQLVAIGASALLAAAGVSARAHRLVREPDARPAARPSTPALPAPRQRSLWAAPYFRALTALGALGGLVSLGIDVQFYAAAARAGAGSAAFFADFYWITGVVSLALQLGAAERVQKTLGIAGALLVLPAAVLGGVGLVTVASSAAGRAIFRVAENGVRSSIHQSSWEQLFLAIDRERRGAAKMFVDGVAVRVATAVGALGLYAWGGLGSGADLRWLPWAIAAGAVACVALTSTLRRLACGGAPEQLDELDDAPQLMRFPDACPTVASLGAARGGSTSSTLAR